MGEILSPGEIDLLRAAFIENGAAADAWVRWRDAVDWDAHLDHASFALLPRVYRNLGRLDVHDPLMPRLKGVAHQAWLANQRRAVAISPALDRWESAGVEVLVLPPTQRLLLDGCAVLSGKEPLSLGVRPGQAETALRCLLAAGWRSREIRVPRWSLTGYSLGARHLLLHGGQARLLLNWGLEGWLGERAGEAWDRAAPDRLGRHPVRRIDPADALELELRRPERDAPLGRMAELLMIAQDGKPDWSRLEGAVRQRPVRPYWAPALALLQPFLEQWGAPPDLQRWCGSPAPPAARPQGSLIGRCRRDWRAFRSSLGDSRGMLPSLMQLPGYLMGSWHLRGLGELPKGLIIRLRSGADERARPR